MGGRDRLVEGRGLGEREVSDARSRALQAELDRQRELGAFRLEFTSDVFAFAEVVAQARETALHPLPALDGAEAMAALKARGTALEAVMTTPSEGTDLGVLAQVEGLVDEWRRLQTAIALRLRGDFSPVPLGLPKPTLMPPSSSWSRLHSMMVRPSAGSSRAPSRCSRAPRRRPCR